MSIYEVFLQLAESLNGAAITGQFPRDVLWLISALFGFWLLVLLALSPLAVVKGWFELGKK